MAALSVFVFQCADSDLHALTLYRSGDNLPADACAGSWVYRARLLQSRNPADRFRCGDGNADAGRLLLGALQLRDHIFLGLRGLRSTRMDELRAAMRALAAETQRIERELESCQDPPSNSELKALQKRVDGIQHGLNRLQTAMDAWSEETEGV